MVNPEMLWRRNRHLNSTVAREPHSPLSDNQTPIVFISSTEVSEEERKVGVLREIKEMKEGKEWGWGSQDELSCFIRKPCFRGRRRDSSWS